MHENLVRRLKVGDHPKRILRTDSSAVEKVPLSGKYKGICTKEVLDEAENSDGGKAVPLQAMQAMRVPGGGAPRFHDNRHLNVVRLLALRTGRLYTPGNIPVTHFC
jgi:hypothetical protein